MGIKLEQTPPSLIVCPEKEAFPKGKAPPLERLYVLLKTYNIKHGIPQTE